MPTAASHQTRTCLSLSLHLSRIDITFSRPFRTFGQADDASAAAGDEMSIEMFKYTIITAVQNMYGQVGRAAIDPDVLSYDAPTCVAVLAVDDR